MQTTIDEQMEAVKLAMTLCQLAIINRVEENKVIFQNQNIDFNNELFHYTKNKSWIALNDAYSTLASVKLNNLYK